MTPAAEALSAALLHFVWQGIAVGALLAIGLFLLRKSSAGMRYTASCLALLAIVVAPVVTGVWHYRTSPAYEARGLLMEQAEYSTTASSSAAMQDASQPDYTWIIPAWLAGVTTFGLRLVWAGGHSFRLRRRGTPADSSVHSMVWNLAERCGVQRRIQVLLSSVADVPGVVGWLRPVILLPPAALFGLTPQQFEAVIAHELAHIRRHDYLVNILQLISETLFFYHPAVWWISSRIRHERELCCDDFAVRCCGDAVNYARALATLERMRPVMPTFVMGSANGPLLHRIQRLLESDRAEHGPSKLVCAIGLLVGVLSLGFFMTNAKAQSQNPTRDNAAPIELAKARQELQQQIEALPVLPAPPTPPAAPPAPTIPVPAATEVPASTATSPAAPAAPLPPMSLPQQVPEPPIPPAPPPPRVLALLPLLQSFRSLEEGTWMFVDGDSAIRFRMDGKTYILRDKEILDRVRAMSVSQASEVESALALAGRQLDELNQVKRELERSLRNKDVERNLQRMSEELKRMAQTSEDELNVAAVQLQLARLDAENRKLELAMQEKETSLLELQARLTLMETQQARRMTERIRIQEILRQAIANGKAEVVP